MELFSDAFKELVRECVEDPETVVLGVCRRARRPCLPVGAGS